MTVEEETSGPIKSKHEQPIQVFDYLQQTPESHQDRCTKFGITEEFLKNELIEVGFVENILKEVIVIQSSQKLILNLDQIILLENKQVLGKIEDVFGRIERPHYSIIIDAYNYQFIKNESLKQQKVYILKEGQKIIDQNRLKQLKQQKGCDASNQYDEEVMNDNDQEYSDDELEEKNKKRKGSKGQKKRVEQDLLEAYKAMNDDISKKEESSQFESKIQKRPYLAGGIPNLLYKESEK